MRRLRLLLGVPALSLLGIAACSSLLGIEDVHQGPAPGAEAGTSGEPDGGESNGGFANAGGANGGAAQAGSAMGGAPDAGAAGKDSAGAGNSAGSSGEAGAAGAAPIGSTVTGHVIDFWGHKLSNVPVEIGGKQVLTDFQGAFAIADVPDEYDVSLIIQFVSTVTQTHGYAFQGLTRRDPTLQVYTGTADVSALLDTSFTGTAQSVTGKRTLSFAMGGPDGKFERSTAPTGGSFGMSVTWVGPLTTSEGAHALVFQNNDTTGVPEGYYAYDTATVLLSSTTTNHSMLSLDLKPATIASKALVGTVTPGNFSNRSNTVSLRFGDGAAIQIANLTPTSDNFSYLVPTIPGASVSLAAVEGCISNLGCAIVHKDGLSGGTTVPSLTIPAPMKNLTLTPSGAVDANTQFSCTPSAGDAGPYVSVMKNSQSQNDRLIVITSKRPFKLPSVVNGSYVPVHGESYNWQIETHGAPSSVDEMTGPSGFIDSFGGKPADLEPRGPRTSDGTFTMSVVKPITIAN